MSAQIPTEPGLYLFIGTTNLRRTPRLEGVCVFRVRGPGAWWSSVYMPGEDRDFYGAFIRVPDADIDRAVAEANAMVARAIFHRIREVERGTTLKWDREYEKRQLLRGLDAEILTMVEDLLKAEAP